jgi:hypothetical protein
MTGNAILADRDQVMGSCELLIESFAGVALVGAAFEANSFLVYDCESIVDIRTDKGFTYR